MNVALAALIVILYQKSVQVLNYYNLPDKHLKLDNTSPSYCLPNYFLAFLSISRSQTL